MSVEISREFALPGVTVRFRFSGQTDRGAVRRINEDSFLMSAPLFVIADGMGGRAFGDRASQAAIATFADALMDDAPASATAILQTVTRANAAVLELSVGSDALSGTTLTVARLDTDDTALADGTALAEVDATSISVSRHTEPRWYLVIEGREPVAIEGQLYLGRNPVAPADHPSARVLAVDDTAKSVSKTHAMLEVDADGLWVHDLDSTNGVWVVPAGEGATAVTPGQRIAVPAGADLELGDFVIQVEQG